MPADERNVLDVAACAGGLEVAALSAEPADRRHSTLDTEATTIEEMAHDLAIAIASAVEADGAVAVRSLPTVRRLIAAAREPQREVRAELQ